MKKGRRRRPLKASDVLIIDITEEEHERLWSQVVACPEVEELMHEQGVPDCQLLAAYAVLRKLKMPICKVVNADLVPPSRLMYQEWEIEPRHKDDWFYFTATYFRRVYFLGWMTQCDIRTRKQRVKTSDLRPVSAFPDNPKCRWRDFPTLR